MHRAPALADGSATHGSALQPEQALRPSRSRALRIGDTAARVLLGLAFLVFGLDGLDAG